KPSWTTPSATTSPSAWCAASARPSANPPCRRCAACRCCAEPGAPALYFQASIGSVALVAARDGLAVAPGAARKAGRAGRAFGRHQRHALAPLMLQRSLQRQIPLRVGRGAVGAQALLREGRKLARQRERALQ